MTGPTVPWCCGCCWPLRLREPAPASLLSFLLGFLLAFSRRPWPPFLLFCPASPTAGRVNKECPAASASEETPGMTQGSRRGVGRKLGGGCGGGGEVGVTAFRQSGSPSRPPQTSGHFRGPRNLGTEMGSQEPFTLHPSMNQTPSSSLCLPQTLDPNGPRCLVQLSGQAGQPPAPLAHSTASGGNCHITASYRLCDLGHIATPLWFSASPSVDPSDL